MSKRIGVAYLTNGKVCIVHQSDASDHVDDVYIVPVEDDGEDAKDYVHNLLLTEDERHAMAGACAAARLHKVCGDSDQGRFDWNEAADKIHQLQSMILAQVASRMMPWMYRPLGGWPKEEQDDGSTNCGN